MANGATQAVENATRLSEIGFPEFTAKLITDTFDAITASYMDQMAQYMAVVQAVSQTLQDYINNTADDISADEIGAFLLGIGGLNDDALNFLLGDSTAAASLNTTEVATINNAVALAARGWSINRPSVFWQPQQIQKNKRSLRQSRVALQTTNMIFCRPWFGRACFVSTWTMESLRRDSHLRPMEKWSPRRQKLTATDFETKSASAFGVAGGFGGLIGTTVAGFGGGHRIQSKQVAPHCHHITRNSS